MASASRAHQLLAERWAPLPGFGAYEISDHGRVRTVVSANPKRGQRRNSVIRKTRLGRDGYLQVVLNSDGVLTPRSIHVLVAAAFIGPRPKGQEVRHLNGDNLDNRLSNLAYGTSSENKFDSVRNGVHRNVRKTHCPKGHEYTDANTLLYGPRKTWRQCRACKRKGNK